MESIIFFHFVVATIVKHEASDWWHGVWKTTKATKGYGESSLICWQWWASYASNEQPWKDKNLIRLAINLAVLKHYKSILWEIRKCPFCGTERSINADCKYECLECGTCYWQNDGNTPRLIGCPDCREGQEKINADGLYVCKMCETQWRQEIMESSPNYGKVNCQTPGCDVELEFMPGWTMHFCEYCDDCTEACSPDRI